MDQPSLDRNLLYGILALQVELVNTDRFVSAMVKCATEQARPHGEILVEQGELAT
jgi:hypothetical protein